MKRRMRSRADGIFRLRRPSGTTGSLLVDKAGFHERFVVENKDRYLEGRWFFDEWDKALAAHGLKKQQRVEYIWVK